MRSKIVSVIFFKIIAAAFLFFGVVVNARTFSSAIVGEIATHLALINILALVVNIGLSTSIIYFSAGSLDRAVVCAKKANIFSAVVLVSMLPLFLISNQPLQILVISCELSLLANSQAIFQVTEKYFIYGVLSAAFPLALFFSAVLSGFFAAEDICFFWNSVAVIVGIFVIAPFILGLIPIKSFFGVIGPRDKLFISYGLKSASFNATSIFIYSIDLFFLSYFYTGAVVGIYSVAQHLAKSSLLLVDSVGILIFSRIAAKSLSRSDLIKIYSLCLFFIVGLLFFWMLLGRTLLFHLYGSEYLSAYPVVFIILCAAFFVTIYKIKTRELAAVNSWWALFQAQGLILCFAAVFLFFLTNLIDPMIAASSALCCAFIVGSIFLFLKKP